MALDDKELGELQSLAGSIKSKLEFDAQLTFCSPEETKKSEKYNKKGIAN